MRSFNRMTNIRYSDFICSSEYINFDILLNKLQDGILIEVSYKDAWLNWWILNKSDEMIIKIKNLPNFNSAIFKKITGIKL